MSEELDPTEFVQRIRQLGAERDSQDADRVRKLEEEIMQGRSERLARRAERARSLSPDKPSTPTPQPLRSSTNTPREVQEKAAETPTPIMNPPTREKARDESLEALTGLPAQAIEDLEPRKPTPNAAVLGRRSTLSWQQRPQSGGGVRRPISRSTSPNKSSPHDTPEPSSPATSTLSRAQIAENLGSKSPDWFKQTEDRGMGSAALRKNHEDDVADAEPALGKMQLPGMSRDSKSSLESSSPPRADSGRGSVHLSANTPILGANDETPRPTKSPLPQLDSQKFAFPSFPSSASEHDVEDEAASSRALAMSPTQGRISPVRTERPASPTKGMGGFVQSAMLKRSDSVSKRWSTQTPQGLTRQNSTLSNRGSVVLSNYGTSSKSDARPSSVSGDNSMESSSRPGSSSSNLTITKDTMDREEHEFVKPALPYHSRSKSVASTFSQRKKLQDEPKEPKEPKEETSPPSPSKRWSPTKSSWLESALKRPESPKTMLPPPQQPAWMTEINRAKQQRGSVDLGKDGPFHSSQADPPGSGRTSPFKEVQLRPTSLRRAESPTKDQSPSFRKPESPLKDDLRSFRRPESPEKDKSHGFRRPESHKRGESFDFRRPESPKKDDLVSLRKPESPKATESPIPLRRNDTNEEPSEPVQPSPEPKSIISSKPSIAAGEIIEESLPLNDSTQIATEAPAQTDSKPSLSTTRFSKVSALPAPLTKVKSDVPPTKDFRASLRSRQGTQGTSDVPKKDSVNELANVFGRLKKAETKNYVAPDLLKDNILRGKRGLSLTGGPKPTARRDEFRESIVTTKAAMLAKAEEVGSAAHKRADSSSDPPPMPEAIARRKTLSGRSDSISNPPPVKEQEATPEAISRQKIIRLSKQASPEKLAEPSTTSTSATKEPPRSNKLADRFNPALASLLARGPPAPSANASSSSGASSETPARSSQEEKKGPAPELTHITKGRARGPRRRAPTNEPPESDNLADRFNPALAGLLARGPPALSANTSSSSDALSETPAGSNQEEKKGPAPELTHITKGRARGPKRRAPAANRAVAEPDSALQKVAPAAAVPLVRAEQTLASNEVSKTDITPEERPVIRTPARESFEAKIATPINSPVEPPMSRSASQKSFKAKVATPTKSPTGSPMGSPIIRSSSQKSFKAKVATPTKSPMGSPMGSPIIRSSSQNSFKAKVATPTKSPMGSPMGSPIIRSTSRGSFKAQPPTPVRSSVELPTIRSVSRESLMAKIATPVKVPEEPLMIRTASRESFKARLGAPSTLSEESPITRTLSQESFKAKPVTLLDSSEELPAARAPRRESLTPKPAVPPKSPDLSRRLDTPPSPKPAIPAKSPDLSRRLDTPPSPKPAISAKSPDLSRRLDTPPSPKPAIPAKSPDLSRRLDTPPSPKPAIPAKSPDLSRRLDTPPSPKPAISAKSPDLSRRLDTPPSPKPAIPAKSPDLSRRLDTPPSPKPAIPAKSPDLSRRLDMPPSPKPAIPAKSPDLSRRLDMSPSPEFPRRPASLKINKKASPGFTVSQRRPANPEVAEPPKSASPSQKIPVFRWSRPLPTLPANPDVQAKVSSALPDIAPPNPVVPPKDDVPSPERSRFSVKSASALWSRQSALSPTLTKPNSPAKLPTRADEQALVANAGPARSPEPVVAPQIQNPKPKPVGLGLGGFGSFGGLVAARARVQSPLEHKALPATPPATGDLKPQSELFKASLTPPRTDDLFGNFFDEPPVTTGELPENINSIEILQSPPLDLGPNGKIRTHRKQIQEITGDGKLSAVPIQEEHVLYQDSMYICTHVFGDSKGARTTEVYLWSGSGVAEATLEDAQLFGRNIAKQNQAKLVVLRQGKETPNFFEALGGIVLTRRGSRPASKEYMLCGRRHLGHIAFDEVDFSLKSLCSGFTYIISTEAGRLGRIFLWKGRGCTQEEVSAARLMGMDLTMTGEIVEINEGSETPELFAALPPNKASVASNGKIPPVPRSADYWRYKATSEKYRTRLFKIEQQQGSFGWGQGLQVSAFFPPLLRRPSWGMFATAGEKPIEPPQTPVTPKSPLPPVTTKVVEIMPFCQRDLEPEYIYVLDAFFDIYIIVGALSRSQSAAFSTALLFAQEYSILAVSEDDRPFMPVTTVVLEGVPKDMKAVFRFWDDNLIPAAGLMSGKLGRGKSLRIVGLEKAIAATRR